MYFPNLEILKIKLNEQLVLNFDSWLGTMAPLYTRKINAVDYAVREKIDIDTCIRLFDMAVEANVLVPRIVVTDDFGTPHGTFRKNKDIPSEVMNYEYDEICIIEERNKEIIYELIESPKQQAALEADVSVSSINSNRLDTVNITIPALQKSNAAATLEQLGVDF